MTGPGRAHAREYGGVVLVATAGIAIGLLAPGFLQALTLLGLSDRGAGVVVASNFYAIALGAFLATFLVHLEPGRRVVTSLIAVLGACDLLCLTTGKGPLLVPLRIVAGLTGGLATGFGFAMMARTAVPARGFATLLAYQALVGGATLIALPYLIPHLGATVIFGVLLLSDALGLVAVSLLPAAVFRVASTGRVSTGKVILTAGSLVTLGAVLVSQSAKMAIFAYFGRLGTVAGHSLAWVGICSGAAGWAIVPGAAAAALIGARFGSFMPLCAGFVVIVVGIAAMHLDRLPAVYLLAGVLIGFSGGFIIPLLMGICAALDGAGRVAVLAGTASKIGMATGPMIVALLLSFYPVTVATHVAFGLALLAASLSLGAATLFARAKSPLHAAAA